MLLRGVAQGWRDGNGAAFFPWWMEPRYRLEAVDHHLVVCTLCSCYPRAVLGYPPFWYKSAAYRARAVRDPRGLLAEWGTVLSAEVP